MTKKNDPRLMTRSQIMEEYEREVLHIKASREHPQLVSMALNEARRWLDDALSMARPDTDAKESPELRMDVRPLGQLLKENIHRKEEEQRLAELRRLREIERQQAEHRERCLAWFNKWASRVGDEISAGGVPKPARIPSFVGGKGGIDEPGNEDHWLWREVVRPWAQHEGVIVEVSWDHDGMGMESWHNISVKPA